MLSIIQAIKRNIKSIALLVMAFYFAPTFSASTVLISTAQAMPVQINLKMQGSKHCHDHRGYRNFCHHHDGRNQYRKHHNHHRLGRREHYEH